MVDHTDPGGPDHALDASQSLGEPEEVFADSTSHHPDSLLNLNNLNQIRDVASTEEKERLFLEKLRLCSILHRFVDPTLETPRSYREKEAKRRTLSELVVATRTEQQALSTGVVSALCAMVSANIFRDMPAPLVPNAPEFDPEEDEPLLAPDWEHVQMVYELLMKFLESPVARRPETPKVHITENFVDRMIALFYNEDPRERTCIRTLLHKIYGMYVPLRRRIRRTMEHIFCRVTYDEHGKCNGVPDLLQILGSIINGFALPLKDEHVAFLLRTLVPMHSASSYSLFHEELKYCTIQFIEKEGSLAIPVTKGLLRFWSKVNSMKQVMFLYEIEEILEIIPDAEFAAVKVPVFTQVADCIRSPHFQVAERALAMFNSGLVFNLVTQHKETILPIVAPVVNKCVSLKTYWNSTILEIAVHLRKRLRDIDYAAFDAALHSHKRKRMESEGSQDERRRKWQRLQEMAEENGGAGSAVSGVNLAEIPSFSPPELGARHMDPAEEGEDDLATEMPINGGAEPPRALLVRRKSLLPRDPSIQQALADYSKTHPDATAHIEQVPTAEVVESSANEPQWLQQNMVDGLMHSAAPATPHDAPA